MLHTETNTVPLYKRLNEQRCKDEYWESKGLFIQSSEYGNIATFDKGYTQCKIDCEYTALAVNNLHNLAEALEGLANVISEQLPIGSDKALLPIFKKYQEAKEAIRKIS